MKKNTIKKLCTKLLTAISLTVCVILYSCNREVVQIKFGKDICAHCMMTIVDKKFGGVIMNDKGKAYKFDAVECMAQYEVDKIPESDDGDYSSYTIDVSNPGELIKTGEAYFVLSESIKSPMSGNLSSYRNRSDAENFIKENGGEILDWNRVKDKLKNN